MIVMTKLVLRECLKVYFINCCSSQPVLLIRCIVDCMTECWLKSSLLPLWLDNRPDTPVVVRSGTGILSWEYQPIGWQWSPSTLVSYRQDMHRPVYAQVTAASALWVGTRVEQSAIILKKGTSATNSSSGNWKHFCLRVSWSYHCTYRVKLTRCKHSICWQLC